MITSLTIALLLMHAYVEDTSRYSNDRDVFARDVMAGTAAAEVAFTEVVASSSGQPPQELSDVAGCPNEPESYTRITDQPWSEIPPLAPARDRYGWRTHGTRNMAIVSDPTAPLSPDGALRIDFPATLKGGTSPVAIERMLSQDGSSLRNWTELYICFALQIPVGFTNSGNTGTKFMQIGNSTVHPVTIPKVWGGAYVNLFGGTRDQGTTGINIAGKNNLNRNMIIPWSWGRHLGTWHVFEYQLIPNSTGKPDGRFTAWVDGRLVDQRDGVRWYNPQVDMTRHGFNWVKVGPIYGGERARRGGG